MPASPNELESAAPTLPQLSDGEEAKPYLQIFHKISGAIPLRFLHRFSCTKHSTGQLGCKVPRRKVPAREKKAAQFY
jgi:hypothetical protein